MSQNDTTVSIMYSGDITFSFFFFNFAFLVEQIEILELPQSCAQGLLLVSGSKDLSNEIRKQITLTSSIL